MFYIIDTHALVWFLEGNRRLSLAAKNALSEADVYIVVPTLVLAEVTFLYAKQRITLDVPRVLSYIASTPNCTIYPLDEEVVSHLPTTLDIHDAIIVATAIVYRDVLGEDVAVITKDSEITDSHLVPVVW